MEDRIYDIISTLTLVTSAEDAADMRERLAAHIDVLIANDFPALVHILYRIDVNETKIRMLLEDTAGAYASYTIADCIIERQLQKMKQAGDDRKTRIDIPEDEAW